MQLVRRALILLVFPALLHAQVSVSGENKAEDFNKSVYGLGFAGGSASGIGISFRDHFPSKISLQLVFGILKDKVNTFISTGAEVQYDLVRGNTTRFYFGPAVAYFYNGSDRNKFDAPTRFGIGLGGEFNIRDALHFSVEGMFVFFSDGSIIPLPQASIHYYFY
ncbi:MAG TPA: hypothetical protein VMM37_10285 [Bacteroidota bacterium]|nr:hypothetical protein [Bacteroidota bacterium]